MFASLFLAPGRASAQGDCERGCTELIMSPECPTHGFPVTRTRLRLVGTDVWATGEVSLYDGMRLMRFIAGGMPDVPEKDRIRPESVELVDVTTGMVVAIP